MINRAPVYCDICKTLPAFNVSGEFISLTLLHPTATRIQVALNAAIPACSLCINRRLYKIATTKAVVISDAQRRRALIYDLLIGVGIPLLQIIAGKCANMFTLYRLFTGMQFTRVCCFGKSLQHT